MPECARGRPGRVHAVSAKRPASPLPAERGESVSLAVAGGVAAGTQGTRKRWGANPRPTPSSLCALGQVSRASVSHPG